MEISPALEASIEQAIPDIKRLLQPSALYTTVTRATLEKTTPLEIPKKAVAVSVIAVSLGSALEAERQLVLATENADPLREPMLSAFEAEALSQSISFAARLLQEGAKEEECELSIPMIVDNPTLWPSLAALLTTSRIGLEIPPETPTLPSYARLAWISWIPLRKERKSSPAAARMEKAAV